MQQKIDTRLTTFARKHILLLSFCLLLSCISWSQQDSLQSFESLAEKIYLQLDNKVYTNNKTIWFKAIVASAADHTPSTLSGVLHVELIDPNEQIVEQKLIRLENGLGNGFFELNQSYASGIYLIRAYTEWNKNFGNDFFFTEYIQVFATATTAQPNPIQHITLIEQQDNLRRLRASFNPLVIDSLHTKDLTVFVSFGDHKDTLSIKKSGNDNYVADYVLPGNYPFITFQLQTKNDFRYAKTILLNKDFLDLQFFPESGELVQGLPAIVGFKALDSAGNGIFIEGEIINKQDEVITTFKSNPLGMGTFSLPAVDSMQKYMARISSVVGAPAKMFALPAIAAKGNILSVSKTNDKIRLKISSNYLVSDTMLVRASCRGMIYFDIKGNIKNGKIEFSLPANTLPEGIVCFTLMAAGMEPVAERLYFNEQAGTRLNLSLSTDKRLYTPREPTHLTVDAKDAEGQPVYASLSLLVFNKTQLAAIQDKRQNILSYLLLTSDLKGDIEDPGFYFTKDNNRYDDLNALLLTQGWRKYLYQKPGGTIVFQPEINLTVSGRVTGGLLRSKEKKGTALTMMTFTKPPSVQTQTADSLGRFSFIVKEEGEQKINVLIQSANKSGVKKDYTITLDKKKTPQVLFDHIKSAEKPDSIVQEYVKKSIERKKTEDAYTASSEGITLGEVVVKSYLMTPERKLVTDRFGKPKTVIEGNAIREKEEKWSYGLYSVLLFNFPDKVKIDRRSDGNLYARLHNSELTLVVIDGVPVQPHDYPLIPNIPPSEVKTFELIEYAKNFSTLYCEVFPQGCLTAPAWGNVISIFTYGRQGLFGANRAVGIMKTAVPAFAAPREFYAPKYDQLKPANALKPDLRTLIHWQPDLRTDSTGKALASFYNADVTGTMQLVVEAISANGQIGYQEINFEVKK